MTHDIEKFGNNTDNVFTIAAASHIPWMDTRGNTKGLGFNFWRTSTTTRIIQEMYLPAFTRFPVFSQPDFSRMSHHFRMHWKMNWEPRQNKMSQEYLKNETTCRNLIQNGKMLSKGNTKNTWTLELLEHWVEGGTIGIVEAKLGLISSIHHKPSKREHIDSSMRDKATDAKT